MRTTVTAVALSLFLSCGGGEEPATSRLLALEGVADVWRKAVCDKIFTCCSSAELMLNPDDVAKDRASCETRLDGETTFFLADLAGSVAAGRIVYHADKMATCLEELRARDCSLAKTPAGERDVTALCAGVFEPKVPTGGACTEYWDCIDGWCVGDMGDLKDVCAPLGEEGAVCDEGTECRSGICGEQTVCIKRPAGSGNICNLGTTNAGQHSEGQQRRWR